ncbi:PASTA domain-containing protein [Streptomyces sp. B6B3]|uniref:PASTA domain-containing protein n=1 Tax=Streptomyces sp. B6B3 TaxID=3153570 RepID=UPI00325EF4F0
MTFHQQPTTRPPADGRNAWRRLPGWQKALIIVSAFIPLGIIGSLLGAGDPAKNAADTAGPAPDVGSTDPQPQNANEAENAEDTESAEDTDEEADLPDLTGMGLQAAQDAAQEAGFYLLTSHDASGRDRMQVWDRNWQVCFQTPDAGRHPSDVEVDFGVVDLDEECPAEDEGTGEGPEAAYGTMPSLVGESANVARTALPDNASITVRDVSGEERIVFLESNWQVCAQDPAAGEAFEGQPVTLGVVKFGEACP